MSMSRAGVGIAIVFAVQSFAEPVVLKGAMLAPLLGKPISAVRFFGTSGAPVPFQIDEVDSSGDYVCPSGKEPNGARIGGLLDTNDEITFLWEDLDAQSAQTVQSLGLPIRVNRGSQSRLLWCSADSTLPLSPTVYIHYDPQQEKVITPYYYAVFGHDRFHFVRAGCMDFANNRYIDMTGELRIRLTLRALWGILPITYTENNLVCLVKRYKAGPIRLIRRGDFHLNLGLWIKGSSAAVNQICYPQMTGVPVIAHLPIRLKFLFKEAYLEMTPVLTRQAQAFSYQIPSVRADFSFEPSTPLDTFIRVNPDHSLMFCVNRSSGYGWLLQTSMPSGLMGESGYVFKRCGADSSIGYCGFKISLNDLPAGKYLINNWVFFGRNPSQLF
ncbi:MAG: hypothetical protein PHC61_05900, partial [Chitinivibrionales bacterium]|nr:hypothetical protein [Chitinivibrionales bacterium]